MSKLVFQRLIIAISSLLLIGTAAAQTQEVTLGCGGATGAYTLQLCPALQKAMTAKGFSKVSIHEGQGSGANIASVKEGTKTAALVQMDVLAQALLDDPDLELFLPLGQISPEALFMVVKDPKSGGRVTDFDTLTQNYPADLQPKPFKVGVAGSEKSGSYLTMQTLIKNFPGLAKNVQLKALGDMSPQVAYNYLNSGVMDVIMFVMMPDITNERLSMVIQSKVWKFLDVNDPRIAAINFSGQPVYSLMEIPLQGALSVAWKTAVGKDMPVLRTAVTTATLLVDPSRTPDKVVRALSEVANAHDLLPDKSPTGVAKRWFDAARGKTK